MTTRSYRPSNGTEGLDFREEFCFRCERDRAFRETDGEEAGCRILGDTLIYMADDPRYPKEWVQDEQGARCTAFEAEATREGGTT